MALNLYKVVGMLHILLITSVLRAGAFCLLGYSEQVTATQSIAEERMPLAPRWRNKGDCGPLALHVLLKINGDEEVTIDFCKDMLEYHESRGCSMVDLIEAGKELGADLEVRFLSGNDLKRLGKPCIIHKEGVGESAVGHFVPVVGFSRNADRFYVIDTDTADLMELPEDTVIRGFSGYVIMARPTKYSHATRVAMFFLPTTALSLVFLQLLIWAKAKLHRP